MTPLLKFFFVVSYVLLAAFVGAFADSMPKGRVMLITNCVKVVGCLMMFFHDAHRARLPATHVLLAYGVVGLRRRRLFAGQVRHPDRASAAPAAGRSPTAGSKALTVASIILGTLLGGVLDQPRGVRACCSTSTSPCIDTGIDTPPEAAIAVIVVFYVIAAMFNLYIPDTGVDHRAPSSNPFFLIREFAHCVKLLWRDKLGPDLARDDHAVLGRGRDAAVHRAQLGRSRARLSLSQATVLQGVCAVGIAIGAVLAARFVPLRRAVDVLPVGVAMGLIVIAMIFATTVCRSRSR